MLCTYNKCDIVNNYISIKKKRHHSPGLAWVPVLGWVLPHCCLQTLLSQLCKGGNKF